MAKIPFEQKKAERLVEWNGWINGFSKYLSDDDKNKLELLPNAAELLNDYYWRVARQFIRPLLTETSEEEHNIHYYKIISASELIVMAVLPWKYRDGHSHTADDRAYINAQFALYVGVAIMLNWKIDGKEVVSEKELSQVMHYTEIINTISGTDTLYPHNFTDEHIALLQQLNVNGPLPILINSQNWRLAYIACMAFRNNANT